MKKLLSFVLSLVMVVSALPLTVSAGSDYFTIKDFNPVVDANKEVTLRVVVYQSADQADASEIWFWKWLKEVCNINVEVEQYSNRAEIKNLMFGTGELPDLILNMAVNTREIVNYGVEEEMLLKIDEYMEEYMPNLYAIYQKHPEYQKNMLAPDGHQYSLGNLGDKINYSKLSRVFINQTWLKEANLETPKTLDEFIDMLRVFKQREDCEVPMGGGFDAISPGLAILTALGYVTTQPNGGSVCLRNGKVVLPYGDREIYGEYLKIMNTLYTEELISHDYYTLETPQVRAIAANNATGILAETPYLSSPETFTNWWSMLPLTSAWNDTPVWPDNAHYLSSGIFCIGANTEYPELCCALGDMLFNETGIIYWLLGPQKDSEDLLDFMGGWIVDESGNYDFVDLHTDTTGMYGNSGYTYRMKKVGALTGYICGITGENIARRMCEMASIEYKGFTEWDMTHPDHHYQASLEENVGPYLTEQFPPIVFFDMDTAARITELNTLIGDYWKAESANFITGRRSLTDEELNKYFDQLDSLGFQELLSYYVDYYEDYQATK
jgi:putative aldouronate transport system substrate-binding protein